MSDLNRQHTDPEFNDHPPAAPYFSSEHAPVEQLMAEQGTRPVPDVSLSRGDFWPDEESIEDFLQACTSGAATSGLIPPHDGNLG